MLTSERWIDFEKMEDRVLLGLEQDVSSNKYSKDLAAATTRGMIRRAQTGARMGGQIPMGYRWQYAEQPDGSRRPDKLVPDPVTAAVVRWIFTSYAAGQMSLRQISGKLNERGEPTPSRHSGKGVQGAHWNTSTLRKILVSETYLGWALWNRIHTGRFLGVVDMRATARPTRGGKPEKNPTRTSSASKTPTRRSSTGRPGISANAGSSSAARTRRRCGARAVGPVEPPHLLPLRSSYEPPEG